jgi:hypothetical protein
MIRPITILHTKVARLLVDKSLVGLAGLGGVILWNLEGRWGLVSAPILANAVDAWRDHQKMTSLNAGTPARDFFIGWNQAKAIPAEVVKDLLTPEESAPQK